MHVGRVENKPRPANDNGLRRRGLRSGRNVGVASDRLRQQLGNGDRILAGWKGGNEVVKESHLHIAGKLAVICG